jgi:hypothetical protein
MRGRPCLKSKIGCVALKIASFNDHECEAVIGLHNDLI